MKNLSRGGLLFVSEALLPIRCLGGPRSDHARNGSVAAMSTASASAHLLGAVASGYQGPPELTVARAFTEWTFDPLMAVLVVILGASYLAGARRVRDWPVARPIWFCGLGIG